MNEIHSLTNVEKTMLNTIYNVHNVGVGALDYDVRPGVFTMDGVRVAHMEGDDVTLDIAAVPMKKAKVLRNEFGQLVTEGLPEGCFVHVKNKVMEGDFKVGCSSGLCTDIQLAPNGNSWRGSDCYPVPRKFIKYAYIPLGANDEKTGEKRNVFPPSGCYRDGHTYFFFDNGARSLHVFWADDNGVAVPYYGAEAINYLDTHYGSCGGFIETVEFVGA